MKTLYIDESGVPELSERGTFVIVSGVLIDEKDEQGLLFLVERIKKKYKIDLKKHIHAVDIFEHPKESCYLGATKRRLKDLRKDFQNDFWHLIKEYEIEHYTVKVPKHLVRDALFGKKYYDKGDFWIKEAAAGEFYAIIDRHLPADIGVNGICHRIVKRLNNFEKLKIVLESRSDADQYTLRNHAHILNNAFDSDTGKAISSPFKEQHMVVFARDFKETVVSIAFANKQVGSAGLEIADMIAYTCNVYFNKTHREKFAMALAGDESHRRSLQTLKSVIRFAGIHKTLNAKHYKEMSQRDIKKYIPGLNARTQRISKRYLKLTYRVSESRHNAGAQ